MAFQMIPLRAEMSETLATIYLDAFRDISINRAMVPERNEAVHAGFTKQNLAWIERQSAEEFFFAIVDPSTGIKTPGVPEGEVIAVGKWKHEKADAQKALPADEVEIPGANVEARREYFAILGAQRAKIMAGQDHMHLLFLAVAPKHARKGAGKIIMDWGVKMADELKLPSFLDATPNGRFLYEKYGFKMVESTTLDLRKHGVDAEYSTCAMVRPVAKAES